MISIECDIFNISQLWSIGVFQSIIHIHIGLSQASQIHLVFGYQSQECVFFLNMLLRGKGLNEVKFYQNMDIKTYVFLKYITSNSVIKRMNHTFTTKIYPAMCRL